MVAHNFNPSMPRAEVRGFPPVETRVQGGWVGVGRRERDAEHRKYCVRRQQKGNSHEASPETNLNLDF